MALEEVSFYNVNGDEINLSNIVNQMINYYDLKLEVGETRVTDFNEGSEIRNLLEAFAVAVYALLEEQYESTRIAFIHSSYGEWLDRIGENPFINLPRIKGEVGIGVVTFTLAEVQNDDFIIPAGTILVSGDDGVEFVTAYDGIIMAGDLTVDVAVECVVEGVIGNVPSMSITTINDNDLNTELLTVFNTDAITGGTDYEDDDFYRQRLLDNVQSEGFGTLSWYQKLGEGVDGVHDVLLVPDIDFTRKVLVNGFTKPFDDSILLNVLTEYTNLDNIVVGHSFTVVKTEYSSLDLEIDLNVLTHIEDSVLEEIIQLMVDGGSADSIDYSGLNINEPLTKDRVESALLMVENIVKVNSIIANNEVLDSLTPDTNTVFKLVNVNFNQTVV